MAFSALALPGDRASIRVWGSHIGVPRATEITSGHATADRLRRVPGKREKSKKPLRGGSLSLDQGSPHTGWARDLTRGCAVGPPLDRSTPAPMLPGPHLGKLRPPRPSPRGGAR